MKMDKTTSFKKIAPVYEEKGQFCVCENIVSDFYIDKSTQFQYNKIFNLHIAIC